MSKELHIALQEAIGDLGTDVLKSPFLVNILQDYGAFDVHDKKKSAIKSMLSDMIAHRHIEEVLLWVNLSKEEIQSKGLKLLRQYGNDNNTRHIIDSVLKALELPALPQTSSPVTAPKTAPIPPAPSNTNSTHQPSKDNDKFSAKNIGCALFGAIIFVPCGLILVSTGEIGGGLLCLLGAIICIVGPFTNSDFWN